MLYASYFFAPFSDVQLFFALKRARKLFRPYAVRCRTQIGRGEVPKVAVLITDQSSSSGAASAVSEALQAHLEGIKIFVIGTTGFSVNQTELVLVSSPPHLQYHQWWTLSDFGLTRFTSIQIMLNNELCRPEYSQF